MINRRHRILPEPRFGRHFCPKQPRMRSAVAVGQFVPGFRKGMRELIRIRVKPARNLQIGRVCPHRDVGCCHHGSMPARGIMRIGHQRSSGRVLWRPLVGACRAFRQLPLKAEQIVKIAIVPLDGIVGPGSFKAAGDCVNAFSAAKAVAPAKALLLNARAFRLRPNILRRVSGTMAFAKGVPAGDQRDSFFIIHCHARKGFADVARRGERVWRAVRSFRVDVNQAHLDGSERIFEIPVAAVAVVTQPFSFWTPINIRFRFPHIFAAAADAGGHAAHGFDCAVAGQYHQIGPGNLAAIFLLDGPQQQPRLVKIAIVWPAVQRCKALRARSGATSAIANAIGAGAVPGHADEQRAVMAIVCWPPVLRGGHQREDVGLQGCEIEALELFGIVEAIGHRIGRRRILVQDGQVQLVWPPKPVGHAEDDCGVPCLAAHRAFGFSVHRTSTPFLICSLCRKILAPAACLSNR